jgi:hypothetical protein
LGTSITRPALYTIVTAGLAVVLLVGVNRLWAAAHEQGDAQKAPHPAKTAAPTTAPPTTPASTAAPTTTAPPTPGPIHAASVDASSQTAAGQNGCGQPTNYDPGNVQDGDPGTAWRTAGDGTGQTVHLVLSGPTHLTTVGLIPGYDRIDPCTQANRFNQMRKVTSVTWTFDGGTTAKQTFAAQPTMQTIDVSVVTTAVTVEITGTTRSSGLDYTPISEIALTGYAAS